MSMMPPKKVDGETPLPAVNKISITLTSRNSKAVEKVCTSIIELAKSKRVKAKGPIRLPNKVLRITTRKSPCGEGTNTWDRFEMRIHKRVIHILSNPDFVKDMNTINIEVGVDVEVIMDKSQE
ncbi:40S ribosomal protein S20 [Tieghemostelium lacteum]|uniref:Small ribosomal subunit protein uS10 n=1 Tax=Tieghemostelium lacteum TaxID=361077 RepID=A0A151ZK16_TIELA|nr:40S ribosomal protein S20 [Tieghemostelium lacteum]|eukprot:KYQ94341.1 40S ribosomal protein S20 [Tieghemostelium lacteum]